MKHIIIWSSVGTQALSHLSGSVEFIKYEGVKTKKARSIVFRAMNRSPATARDANDCGTLKLDGS